MLFSIYFHKLLYALTVQLTLCTALMLGYIPLRQYRACTGISSELCYVTTSPSHHDPAIPILSPVLYMDVKIRRIIYLLVLSPF